MRKSLHNKKLSSELGYNRLSEIRTTAHMTLQLSLMTCEAEVMQTTRQLCNVA